MGDGLVTALNVIMNMIALTSCVVFTVTLSLTDDKCLSEEYVTAIWVLGVLLILVQLIPIGVALKLFHLHDKAFNPTVAVWIMINVGLWIVFFLNLDCFHDKDTTSILLLTALCTVPALITCFYCFLIGITVYANCCN